MAIVPLTNSDFTAFVDDIDFEKVSHRKWEYKNGSVQSVIGKTPIERFVLDEHGNDKKIFFKNGNVFDCRRQNIFIGQKVYAEYYHWGKDTKVKAIRQIGSRFLALVRKGHTVFDVGRFDDFDSALARYKQAEKALCK